MMLFYLVTCDYENTEEVIWTNTSLIYFLDHIPTSGYFHQYQRDNQHFTLTKLLTGYYKL
jgi:hypothetical protein